MQFSALAASLLVLATLASASTECQWGPLFWCQSQEKADRCGKLEYCQENSWQEPADESGTLCVICEALLSLVHNYLEKNITSGELELVLDEFCTYLDVEALINECQHIVNEYFPKIWKLLEDGTDPKTICPMFFSDCPKSEPTEKAPLPAANDAICDACLITAAEMKRFVNRNKTENEVKAAIEEVCKEIPYPPVHEYCEELLKNWSKTWDEVKRDLHNGHICNEEGVCGSGLGQPLQINVVMETMRLHLLRASQTRMKPMADALCTLCLDLAEYLYNWTFNDTVKEIFHKAVIEDCKEGPETPNCKEAMANFSKFWKEQVQDKLHNGKECYGYEEVCGGKLLVPQIRARKEAPLPPANDAICDACLITAVELEKFVNRSKTENEVKAAVEEVCSEYPYSVVQEFCKKILKNWSEIWEEVKQELKYGRICYAEEEACGLALGQPLQVNVVMETMRLHLLRASQTRMRPMADALCTLCVDLAEFLYNWTFNDTVKETFHKAVIEECHNDPGEPVCKEAMANFSKFWKEQVQEKLHNGKECYGYEEVCGGKLLAPQIRARKEAALLPSNDAICEACLITAVEMHKFVERKQTKNEVKAAVEEVCKDYPELQEYCQEVLKNWTKTWDEVERELTKSHVCYEEGVCERRPGQPLQVNVVMKIMRLQQLKASETQLKPMADALCTFCVDLAEYLYNWTLNDTVRDIFHKAVIEECKKEPAEPQCKKALADFPKYWKEEVQDKLHNGKECYGYEEVCGGQLPVPQIKQRKNLMKAMPMDSDMLNGLSNG